MAHSPTDQERKVRAALRRAAGLPARWVIRCAGDTRPLPDDVDHAVALRDWDHRALWSEIMLEELEE